MKIALSLHAARDAGFEEEAPFEEDAFDGEPVETTFGAASLEHARAEQAAASALPLTSRSVPSMESREEGLDELESTPTVVRREEAREEESSDDSVDDGELGESMELDLDEVDEDEEITDSALKSSLPPPPPERIRAML